MTERPCGLVPLDTRTLVEAVRDGDRDAFEPLVTKYEQRIYGLALAMVGDTAGAVEVAQDTFVRAYRALHRYDVERPFYPWLAAIGRRVAQSWIRARSRARARAEGVLDAEAHATESPDPLAEVIAAERRSQLWAAVEALPGGERTAVYLYYRQGLSVKETAAILGVTGGTVKTFLFRARRHLREALGPHDTSDGRAT